MNSLQRLPLLLVALVFSHLPSSGKALAAADEVQLYSIKANRTGASLETLQLELLENKRVPNACDQYIKRFEYNDGELRVELGSEPCFVDRIGHRRAQLLWVLPRSLRKGSKEIHLQVEGRKIGVLRLDGPQVEVRLQ